MSEPSKNYAPTEAHGADGAFLGTYGSPFLAAAREEEELIRQGASPEGAHRAVNSANANKVPVAPQGGYTPCSCRDCMDTAVSSDMAQPELCTECTDAGCEQGQGESDAYGCQRDDAYGDDVGDAGTGHGGYEFRSGA